MGILENKVCIVTGASAGIGATQSCSAGRARKSWQLPAVRNA